MDFAYDCGMKMFLNFTLTFSRIDVRWAEFSFGYSFIKQKQL